MRKRGTMNNDLKTEEMCENWLIQQKAKIKKSTYANYCYLIRKLIEPKLGEIDVMKLKKAYLEQLVLDLQEKEYADSTIYSALRVLKTILRKHAVQNDNYEEMIHHCYLTVHRLESKVLLEDESACIKEYLLKKNDTYALGILLCRSTGIRIGELCGLKWEDIHLDTGIFEIKRTVSRIQNDNYREGLPKTMLYIRTPKSFSSIRTIPIPYFLENYLKEKRKLEDCYFLTGTTRCTVPRNVQKHFKTILKHCNLSDYNFHSLRHGFASSCLESGVECKTVSSILGHSSTQITMDLYVHATLKQKAKCVNMF